MSRIISAALLLAFTLPALADLNFSGYLKSFAVVQDEVNNPLFQSDKIYQSQNSARFMFDGFNDRFSWQLHYELSPVLVSESPERGLSTFNIVGDSYRLTDPDSTLLGEENKNQIFQNLDRLNVQIQLNAGDLTIGRQAVSFGAARIINPTDVFLPFDVRTFNTEYRTGIDAVRFQRPWGDLGEIDVGVILGPGADRENSSAFLQLRTNRDGIDYQLALIDFSEEQLIGFGLQTAIYDLGYWFEAAHVQGDQDYLRVSTGIDYAFSENTFFQIEYHYNGAGSEDPSDYLTNLQSKPYQRGGVFLLGKHYLMPNFTVTISPLWNAGVQAIYNLDDDSAFISLSAQYNLAEDFYMDFGYYHFKGNDLVIRPSGEPQLKSEYGPSPDTLFMSIRYYF